MAAALARAHDEIIVVPMIESLAGVERIDEHGIAFRALQEKLKSMTLSRG